MTSPQDEDLLRGMAGRYLSTDQAFAARLYAEADYLAQLHRSENIQTVIREPDVVVDQLCPMQIQQEVSGGSVITICGQQTKDIVEHQGSVYGTCPACTEQVVADGGKKIGDIR